MIALGRIRISRDGIALAPAGPTAFGRWLAADGVRDRLVLRIAIGWLLAAGTIGALKLLFAPAGSDPIAAPYVLAAILPAFAIMAGHAVFSENDGFRFGGLSITGRWVPIPAERAMRHPQFGADGLLLMLAGGMLFSILVRAFDFYVAFPALHGGTPIWLAPVYALMFFDLLLLSTLYALCFAALLRHSPVAPVLVAITWLFDFGVLLAGYLLFSGWEALPPGVEQQLSLLLSSNLKKAVISTTLWAPYLLLSRRANVTYLRRVRPDDLILAH